MPPQTTGRGFLSISDPPHEINDTHKKRKANKLIRHFFCNSDINVPLGLILWTWNNSSKGLILNYSLCVEKLNRLLFYQPLGQMPETLFWNTKVTIPDKVNNEVTYYTYPRVDIVCCAEKYSRIQSWMENKKQTNKNGWQKSVKNWRSQKHKFYFFNHADLFLNKLN